MDVLSNLLAFLFIYLTFTSSSIYAEDKCVKKSGCSCEFSNGTGIDLSPSAKTTFYTAQIFVEKDKGALYELSIYYYHPCADVLMKMNATKENNFCTGPLSICRHVNLMNLTDTKGTYKMDSGAYNFLGTSNVTEFSSDGSSIIYPNGPSSTIVLLVCAQTDDQLHIFSLEDPERIVLSFYSRNACLKQIEEAGRSLGSTILIIFFSFVVFYLVLGICTKKFLMGATGVEVIPNLGFWSDLPALVKDGWAFTINGFKLPPRGAGPVSSPDPNSYDSI